MDQQCPRCAAAENTVLYQCVRCFSVYCKNCTDSHEGKTCPKCGMSQRLLLVPDKRAETEQE